MSWLNWFSKRTPEVSAREQLEECVKTNIALNEAVRALHDVKEEQIMERNLLILAIIEDAGGHISFDKEFVKDVYTRGLEYKLDDRGDWYELSTYVPDRDEPTEEEDDEDD